VAYTAQERENIRADLVEAARNDPRIIGAALTGSAATGGEDPWSDVDLLFGLREAAELPAVLTDWTSRMYSRHGALHHLDVPFGGATSLSPGASRGRLPSLPRCSAGPRRFCAPRAGERRPRGTRRASPVPAGVSAL